MSKTFILQKPLPDSEVGDEYIYNGTYGRYYKYGNVQDSYWGTENVENNPEWFKLKEEEQPKQKSWYFCPSCDNKQVCAFRGSCQKPQPKEKDTFQWSDELVKDIVVGLYNKIRNKEVMEFTPADYVQQFIQSKSTPKEDKSIPATIDEEAFKNRCTCCGDNLVYIRGKYPKEDKRQTCPTCTTERLEQINEISSKDYGKTYQNN